MRCFRTSAAIFAAALCFVGIDGAHGQAPGETDWQRLKAASDRFGISIPLQPSARAAVARSLDELTREKCDKVAIRGLATALEKAGHRRDAAASQVKFSDTCNGHSDSLQRAVNLYLDISDYEAAAETADKFIALNPLNDTGYFLRALAHEEGKQPEKAIDDYITAIELFTNKDTIADVSYVGLARNYDRIGRSCDAALAIEAWVGINPARHDSAKARSLIASYQAKGNCPASASGHEDIFPISRRGEVIVVAATVNGVRGRFLVDTGASFVSLKESFARKAKVEVEWGSTISFNTANGISKGHRGRAATIQLKSISASNVAISVQSDKTGTYGEGIDGLLGMSFLGRFQVAFDNKALRISRRGGGRAERR